MAEKLSRRTFLRGLAYGAAGAAATGAYSDYSAYALVVERKELRLPRWNADGYKVAVISDIHVNHYRAMERAKEAVRIVMREKPDILLVTGDFANTSRSFALDHVRWSFEDLAGVDFPCVAILGNHDYWVEQPHRLERAIRQTPLKVLQNETFDHGGVVIAGVDDAIMRRDDYTFFPKDRTPRNLISILHEPDYVSNMPDHVSLQISGHSHGGQICGPFGYAFHTPKGAKKYKAGFYPDAQVPLYVSRGVGTIGMDVRLFCRPEVSILTLREA